MSDQSKRLQAAGYTPVGLVSSVPPGEDMMNQAAHELDIAPARLVAIDMGEMWQLWIKPDPARAELETARFCVKRLRATLRVEREEHARAQAALNAFRQARDDEAAKRAADPVNDLFNSLFGNFNPTHK